jgi:protein-disulfide isomerase
MTGASFVGDMPDLIWDQGEKVGTSFKCKYCREMKSNRGVTQLKEHLAHRGKNVQKCPFVLSNIKTYFQHDIYKTKDHNINRFRQQLRTDETARTHFDESNGDDYEGEL